MKQLRKPPTVEHKKRRSPAPPGAPRGAPTDNRIRTLHDDAPKPAPPLSPDKAEDVLYLAELEVWKARLKYGNDPDHDEYAAGIVANAGRLARNSVSIVPQPHGNAGPGVWIGTKSAAVVGIVVKALSKLMPGVTVVKPSTGDARVPSSLRPFVKAMRKGEP